MNLVFYLTNLLLFDIPLVYCYINIISSTIFWIYRSFFWYFCWFFFCLWESLWIVFRFRTCFLNVALLSYCAHNFIINLMTSCFCYLLNYIFWSSFKCRCSRLLGWSRSFWLHLPLKFLLTCFAHTFSKKQKLHNLLQIFSL